MFRKIVVCTLLWATVGFCQTTPKPKYRIATVLAVAPHDASSDADPATQAAARTYDVTVKVGNTVYVVLYTPPLGMEDVKYAAGSEVVVLVGENTITYNDISGYAKQVPILSRKTLAAAVTR